MEEERDQTFMCADFIHMWLDNISIRMCSGDACKCTMLLEDHSRNRTYMYKT